MEWILFSILILLVLFFLPLLPLHLAFDREVKKRINFAKDVKYFTHQDYPNLTFKPFTFKGHQGQVLKGGFYAYPEANQKDLIIFVPGYGPGHLAYTAVIEQLCQMGYEVFSFDFTGTGLSEGKNIIGYTQGLTDIQFAFSALKNEGYAQHKKWQLMGHSLGGYVVLNSSANAEYPIQKVISLSGFNNVIDIFKTQRKQFQRWHFYFSIYMFLRYGTQALLMSFRSVKLSNRTFLIMMGEFDSIVPVQENFKIYHAIESHRVQLVELKKKFHNPYLSEIGEQYFMKTFLIERPKVVKSKDEDRIKQFHRKIDYLLATQNDLNVFKKIESFLKSK